MMAWTKVKVLVVMAVIIGIGAGVAAQSSSTAPSTGSQVPAGEKLLHYLVAENQRTRDQLQSVRYSYETISTLPNSRVLERRKQTSAEFPVYQSEKRRVVRKGEFIYSSGDYDRTLADGSAQPKALQALTGRGFTAFWETGSGSCSLFDHKSLKDLSPDAQGHMSVFQGRDILLFGFGTGNNGLAELVASDAGNPRWSVSSAPKGNGRQQYVITQEKEGKKVGECVLDPDQGFAIVEVTVFNPDSHAVVRHCAVEMARDATGAWYPKHVTEDWDGQKTEVTVSEFKVDGAIDEKEFDLTAFHLPAGTYVHHHALDGRVVLETVTGDGKLIDAGARLKSKVPVSKDTETNVHPGK